jgi:DNA topoisomerase-1
MMIKTGRYRSSVVQDTRLQERQTGAPRNPCPKAEGHRRIKSAGAAIAAYGCSNYSAAIKCDFKLWQSGERALPVLRAKFRLRGGKKNPVLACQTAECGFKKPIEEASSAPAPAPGAHPTLHDSAAPPAS